MYANDGWLWLRRRLHTSLLGTLTLVVGLPPQPGKHRRSFSSGKNGQGDLAAAAVRAVQSVDSATPAQIASVFGGASGRSTTDGLYPVLDFEQVHGTQAKASSQHGGLTDACARVPW